MGKAAFCKRLLGSGTDDALVLGLVRGAVQSLFRVSGNDILVCPTACSSPRLKQHTECIGKDNSRAYNCRERSEPWTTTDMTSDQR